MSERDQRYLLANADAVARTRLDALAASFDPVTFRHIEALGIAPGWRCWEVGAGGPSVPAWLADRVGPAGRVVATDIDATALESIGDPAYDVLVHDVARDEAPGEGFDLVHARLVLVHVPERTAALARMAAALRPGGWLLVEDADPELQPLICLDEYAEPQRRANHIRRGFRVLLAERGADLAFGRTLPRLLRAAGLHDVGADGYFPVGTPESAVLERLTIDLLGERLVARGLATPAEVAAYVDDIEAGALDLATAPLISAWGRR